MSEVLPIHIIIDPALVSPSRMEELMMLCSDFSPILETVGHELEAEILEGFDSQGFGIWAPLSAYTKAEKERSGYGDAPDLVRTGALRAGLTQENAPGHKFLVSSNEVTVGVYGDVIPYAYFLDTGTARMPARALLMIRPEAIERIAEIILQWLGGGEGVRIVWDAPLSVGSGDSGPIDLR